MDQTLGHVHARTASATGPVYLLLFPIPVVFFVTALVTDIVYANSAFLMWLHFSQWLIAAGLVFGALAALALLIEFFAGRALRGARFGKVHLGLFYACLIIELCNAFVHTIDGWTAVVPTGMILSIIGALLALASVGTLFVVPVTWVGFRRART